MGILLFLSAFRTWVVGGILGATILGVGVTYGVKKYKEHSYKRQIEKAKIEFMECSNRAKSNAEFQACYARS